MSGEVGDEGAEEEAGVCDGEGAEVVGGRELPQLGGEEDEDGEDVADGAERHHGRDDVRHDGGDDSFRLRLHLRQVPLRRRGVGRLFHHGHLQHRDDIMIEYVV